MSGYKVIIVEEIFAEYRQAQMSPIITFGRIYPEEKLIQVLSTNPLPQLVCVGCVKRCSGEATNSPAIFSISNGSQYLFEPAHNMEIKSIKVVSYSQEFLLRMNGIVDADVISKKCISIIGLGTIGSELTIKLAQTGVGYFNLVDMDTFELSNVCRHASDLFGLGRQKTAVVADLIRHRNPQAQIVSYSADFTKLDSDEREDFVRGSDLLIAATDSPAAQFAANETAFNLGIPAIFVGAYENGYVGEIVYTIPDFTQACYQCIAGFRQENENNAKLKERRKPYSNEDENKNDAVPGLAIDVSYIIAVISAFILSLLDISPLRNVLLRPDKNVLLIQTGNRPVGEFANVFAHPFSVAYADVEIDPICPICHKEEYIANMKEKMNA